ncbi:hypothetical protein [Pararhodobacter aggregans]|uniref:hypothetical protein n=1 Tax=Pararhodobacter aggregans TaxID=404875 RepID=UPI003A92043E
MPDQFDNLTAEKLERWDLYEGVWDNPACWMMVSEDGDYVQFEDAKALIDTLRAERDDPILALRRAILAALAEAADAEMCLNLFGLSSRTGLPRETLRGIVTDLRAEDLAAHHKGLWSEDGTPAGAGYSITDNGREQLRS